MAYEILPATIEDLPDLAVIFEDSFATHPVLSRFNPTATREEVLEHGRKLLGPLLKQDPIYGSRFYKLVDKSSGQILALSRWLQPNPDLTPSQLTTRWHQEEHRSPPQPPTNVALINDFMRQLNAGRRKYIDPSKTYFLHILCVKPGFQGKGLGTMLLKHKLEQIEREGRECYVEASPVGEPLYRKLGWQEVMGMEFDMRAFGVEEGEGWVRVVNLMRPGGGKPN